MATITFGKFKGQQWKTIARTNTGYFEWALAKLDVRAYQGPTQSDIDCYLADVKDSKRAKELVNGYLARTNANQPSLNYSPNLPSPSYPPAELDQTIQDFEAEMLRSFGMFPIKKGYSYERAHTRY